MSFYVQDRVYEDLETLPHRHYALVLGTSKYVAKGKTNKYYDYRLEASKLLVEQDKVDYLLLSGDNRTLQYNEPRTMFLDLRKMGVSESVMFKDFAGFRTLDSVVRASKVFQVPSFTIISQKFHCERALLIAKHYDIDAICFTAKQPDVVFRDTCSRNVCSRESRVRLNYRCKTLFPRCTRTSANSYRIVNDSLIFTLLNQKYLNNWFFTLFFGVFI